MATTLYLVRHAAHDRVGDTLCGRMPGMTLGPDGERQADGIAQRLAAKSIAAMLGTGVSLVATVLLSVSFTGLADLTGLSSEEASLYTGAMYRLKSRRLSAAMRKRLLTAVGVRRSPKTWGISSA